MNHQLAYSSDERHPWVEAYLGHCLGAPDKRESSGLKLDISSDDEMFAYAIDENLHHRGHALISYFRSGLLASQIIEQVVAENQSTTSLDFASGHGRSTRFLSRFLDPADVHVCDIGEGANEFQARTFSAHTVAPSARPQGFRPERGFDAVFAFSFFTHLPKARFRDWLDALWRSVSENGVLVFSTLGPHAMLPGRSFDSQGFFFEGVSESERLELDDYGSTWIEERLLREWISTLDGAGDAVYQQQALWSFQDLWIVKRQGSARPVMLEPLGFLDGARPRSASRVELHGWAFERSSDPGPLEIEVWLNGESKMTTTTQHSRPDVDSLLRAFHPRSDTERTGWVATLELERPVHPEDFLLIEARGKEGRSTVIHASSLEGASLLRLAREADQRARHDLQHVEMKLHAMEQSRFWKLRNRWFAAKGWFG